MATEVPQFDVHDVAFEGPTVRAGDSPATDVTLGTTWRHESGTVHELAGFFDGDGSGEPSGNVFCVRFTPTKPGEWRLIRTASNVPALAGAREGLTITCVESDHPGFWEVDTESPDRRWYRRSDGSHPYLVGNTHYSFLSEHDADGPHDSDVATDVAANAAYFDKLRCSITADRYPDPDCKPFLDDRGEQTDDGEWSHRPNPAWFRDRVDAAVRAAVAEDLVIDLILNGPDTEESRSVLAGPDPTPLLDYVAARYGSFPNVWFCLSNEWDIKTPQFEPTAMVTAGRYLRDRLPHSTPVSTHASPQVWPTSLETYPPWNDHAIVQDKLKTLGEAADVTRASHRTADRKPVVNDELAYQGAGDGWSHEDVIEAFLGAFLGGGYASTGYKPGEKVTQYFWGAFDPDEHTAAEHLRWLANVIETDLTFFRMEPTAIDESPFATLAQNGTVRSGCRVLAWPNREYVLGTNRRHADVVVHLPPGRWDVDRYDVIAMETTTVAEDREARVTVNTPNSRAGMTVCTLRS